MKIQVEIEFDLKSRNRQNYTVDFNYKNVSCLYNSIESMIEKIQEIEAMESFLEVQAETDPETK